MTRSRVWYSVVPALFCSLFAVACVGGATPAAPTGDPVLESGRAVYIRHCSSCHGATGGGGRGRKLSEGKVLEAFPDIADQIAVIADGRSSMPAFSGRLSQEELEAVARFTREVLAVDQPSE